MTLGAYVIFCLKKQGWMAFVKKVVQEYFPC